MVLTPDTLVSAEMPNGTSVCVVRRTNDARWQFERRRIHDGHSLSLLEIPAHYSRDGSPVAIVFLKRGRLARVLCAPNDDVGKYSFDVELLDAGDRLVDPTRKNRTPREDAADGRTSPARLVELASQSRELARLVAKNYATPPNVIEELARSPDAAVRKAAAEHGWLSEATRLTLARDPDVSVRLAVVRPRDRNGPPDVGGYTRLPPSPEVLRVLAHDEEVRVRRSVASILDNRVLPADVEHVLAHDIDASVRLALVKSRGDLEAEPLETLRHDRSKRVRDAAAKLTVRR